MSATFNLNGGLLPYTTTPDLRVGPGPPCSNPSLDVNLFFRVTLGVISIFISLVPARLLWWNGEFAGTVFCLNTVISNSIYVVNALLWRDDNVQTWWSGHGWCDLQVYIVFALQTSYNICLFENMRGLASKVAIQRIGGLTTSERRRQHMISALIIFTLPLLQVILTFFVIRRRYNISTLAGCNAVYDADWIFLVFFVIPSPLFTMAAAVMTVLAFKRFREIAKISNDVMHFRDNAQLARQQRVRRKLYFLFFSILIVVLPIVTTFFVANLLEGMPWKQPYDYQLLHYGRAPDNIYSITFTTSDKMDFGDLTINYVSILSAIAVFITFGTTTEAYNEYRKCLLVLGLRAIFPKLHEEYSPKPASNEKSWWSSLTGSFCNLTRRGSKSNGNRKGSLLPTTEHLSFVKQVGSTPSSSNAACSSQSSTAVQPSSSPREPTFTSHNPWPHLSQEDIEQNCVQLQPPNRHILRNPWLPFRLNSSQLPALTSNQTTKSNRKQPDTSIPPLILTRSELHPYENADTISTPVTGHFNHFNHSKATPQYQPTAATALFSHPPLPQPNTRTVLPKPTNTPAGPRSRSTSDSGSGSSSRSSSNNRTPHPDSPPPPPPSASITTTITGQASRPSKRPNPPLVQCSACGKWRHDDGATAENNNRSRRNKSRGVRVDTRISHYSVVDASDSDGGEKKTGECEVGGGDEEAQR